jgi:uncharacterized damage-inducible protein DinB
VVDLWFLEAVANGAFAPPDGKAEAELTSVSDAVRFYEERLPPAIDRVRSLSGEQLAREMNLLGLVTHPAVIFLSFLIRHNVHHRGQLSAYLRPMGASVPAIYGGSADEPLELAVGN